MKTILTLAIVTCLVFLAPALAEECTPTTYGAGVELSEATPASSILADADAFDGQTVRIEGEVHEVCRMKGCWMEIVAEDQEQTLRVKVEDGEIVFPVAALGHAASAQGKVEIREMSREDWVRWQEHLAEENGETFDSSSLGEGPYRLVQIRGTGAEICL